MGVVDLWLIFATAAVALAALVWQWRNLLAVTGNPGPGDDRVGCTAPSMRDVARPGMFGSRKCQTYFRDVPILGSFRHRRGACPR